MYLCYVAVFFSVYAYALSISDIICNLTDDKCMEVHKQELFAKFLDGNDEHGMEDLDPMHQEVIEGQLPTLTYKITNVTMEGFKKCLADTLKFNLVTFTVHGSFSCPEFKMYGMYDMHGHLFNMPIEGDGDFYLLTKEYHIDFDGVMKTSLGPDGKDHAAVISFTVKPMALAPVLFDFKNLFNGQKELGDNVNKIINENSQQAAQAMQDPAFLAHWTKIVKNFNAILARIPVEDL